MFGGHLSGSRPSFFISHVLMGLGLCSTSFSQTFERKCLFSVLSVLSITGNCLLINSWSYGETKCVPSSQYSDSYHLLKERTSRNLQNWHILWLDEELAPYVSVNIKGCRLFLTVYRHLGSLTVLNPEWIEVSVQVSQEMASRLNNLQIQFER